MKQYRFLSLIVAAIATLQGFAYDFAYTETSHELWMNFGSTIYLNITSSSDDDVKTCEITFESKEIIDGNEIFNKGNSSYEGWVKIPPIIVYQDNEYKVTGIGEHAFQDCDMLKGVNFYTSMEKVGKEAFKNCTSLRSIDFSAKRIEESAFENCTSLVNFNLVSIDWSPEYIGSKAFKGCRNLQSLFLEEINCNNPNYNYTYAEKDAFDVEDGVINCRLTVMYDKGSYYKNTEPWSLFKLIDLTIGPEPNNTASVECPAGDSRIYTIDGRAVNANSIDLLPKGIYICGGKKIIK